MSALAATPAVEYAPLWAVHSEKDARPSFRAWARSEAEAKKSLAAIRDNDVEASSTEYWVMQMTMEEVAGYKHAGVLPQDA